MSLARRATGADADRAMCCDGPASATIQWLLLHSRAILAPLGVLFVALCPTVNFWSAYLPGAGVVRAVHLTAAAALFMGGTVTEATRLYFLWCQSRAYVLRVRGDSAKARTNSCLRFLKSPDSTDEGIGVMRPWLVSCLVVGFVGAGLSLHEEMSASEHELRAARGDVLLSPVATSYCPQPDFKYLQVSTVGECLEATARLRQHWNITHTELNNVKADENAQDSVIFERVALRPGKRFRGILSNGSSFESCLVSANARRSSLHAWSQPNDGDWQEDVPHESLSEANSIPPNTACNLLNFNESARKCVRHDDGQAMSFLARCPSTGQGKCDSFGPLGACLPGGTPSSALNTARNAACCDGTNASFAAVCCAETCVEPAPYAFEPANESPWQQLAHSTGLLPRLDLSVFTCASAIVEPSFVALCVCDPETEKDHCSWTAPNQAKLRVRLFVQESLMAVLLLMNYLAIAIEHMLRRPASTAPGREPREPYIRSLCIHVTRALIPLALVVICFATKAYLSEHGDAAFLQKLSEGTGAAGSSYFLLQMRLFWTSGVAILLYLCAGLWPSRPVIACTIVVTVAVTLLDMAISLGNALTDWVIFWQWVAEDTTLAVAVLLVHTAMQRKWLSGWLCAMACCCNFLLAGLFVLAWAVAAMGVSGLFSVKVLYGDHLLGAGPIITSVVVNAIMQLQALVVMAWCCRCCGQMSVWTICVASRRDESLISPLSPVSPQASTQQAR